MTKNEKENLFQFQISAEYLEYNEGSSPYFSSGVKVQVYKPEDLLMSSEDRTGRTDKFEKKLLGLWLWLGSPVPYAFKTREGDVRSLDAGCLGFLLHRTPPEILPHTDERGIIVAVEPTGKLLTRYAAMSDKLRKDVEKDVANGGAGA